MHAIILAGGFATRLWPLTERIAKPLIPIAGKPLISFLVESLPKNIDITISTNQVFSTDFENWKTEFFPERNIDIFVEDSGGESEKKGALAATALCIQEKKMETDILLLAGDNYFGFDFTDFLKRAKNNPLLAAYDIEDIEEAKKFGVVVPKNKYEVLEFEEKPENPSSTLVSTGAYFFPQHTLPYIIEYSRSHADDLGGIFEYCMQKNITVEYFSFDQQWYDIGSFTAFIQANKTFLQNKNIIHSSCIIDEKSNIDGFCVLEKNVILENVFLENCVIMEGTTLKNVEIRNCLIGPFCMLENTDFHGKIVREKTVVI